MCGRSFAARSNWGPAPLELPTRPRLFSSEIYMGHYLRGSPGLELEDVWRVWVLCLQLEAGQALGAGRFAASLWSARASLAAKLKLS